MSARRAPPGDSRDRARPSLHGAVDPQLRDRHRLLPARLLHDEVQPARQRAGRRTARVPRPPSAPGRGRRAGSARAHARPPGDPRGGHRARRRFAPAGGRLAGRADRPDADARLLRRPRRGRPAPDDRRRRHGARHESGERDHGRLRAHEGEDGRTREHRPRRSPRAGRRLDGRPHADEPLDARPFRRAHRGGREDLSRGRRASVLRRRQPERRLRDLAARRHGLRHRPHQPAQDVLAAARRRRPGRRTDRGPRQPRAVPSGSGRRQGRRTASASTTTARSRSGRCARSPGLSECSSARTRSSSPGARSSGRCRRMRC